MNIDTSNLDYMQTILKLTGLSDKQPVGFPGRSFTELLKGRMEKWFCTYSDPAIDGVRSAVNGSGQLCRPGVYAIYGFDIWHIFLAFLRTFLAHVEFVSSARRHKSCD